MGPVPQLAKCEPTEIIWKTIFHLEVGGAFIRETVRSVAAAKDQLRN